MAVCGYACKYVTGTQAASLDDESAPNLEEHIYNVSNPQTQLVLFDLLKMSIIVQKLLEFNLSYVLLSLIACCVSVILWRRRRLYYLAYKFPGLNGLPILGNVIEFHDITKTIPTARKLMSNVGPLFKLWIGPFFSLVVAKPEYLQIILNNTDTLSKCPRVYNGSNEWIGTGLIIAKPDLWRVHRKLLNPAFNQKILNSYVLIFREQANILVRILKDKVGKEKFNFYNYIDKCTLDIVCETTLCTKVEAQTKTTLPFFFTALGDIFQLLIERVFRVWLHIDFIWQRSARGIKFKKIVGETHSYTNMILDASKEHRNNARIAGNKFTGDDLNRRAFLEILLNAKENHTLSDMEVLHEISTMIFAGYDTVAIAMSYIILCAAFYPDLLKKIQKELDEVFGDSDREIEVDDLPKLEYLERFIKETLRIYPPVSFSARNNTEEVDIGDGYIIPKHTTIWTSHILTHHNPEHWPDPDRFDPDRFLPEECAKRHPYAYIPFSAGLRNCIGFRYAYMMMKVIMSSVFRKYVPKTTIDRTKMEYCIDVVLHLKGGFMISLEDRNKAPQSNSIVQNGNGLLKTWKNSF